MALKGQLQSSLRLILNINNKNWKLNREIPPAITAAAAAARARGQARILAEHVMWEKVTNVGPWPDGPSPRKLLTVGIPNVMAGVIAHLTISTYLHTPKD
jgi:hypothetical protein